MSITSSGSNADGSASQRVRVRHLCETFPDVRVDGNQHLRFQVRGRTFAYYLVDHHGDGRIAIHCKADAGVSQMLSTADPQRCFIPPYLGHRGWLGIWLDVPDVDWTAVSDLLLDAYCLVAPKRLATLAQSARRLA